MFLSSPQTETIINKFSSTTDQKSNVHPHRSVTKEKMYLSIVLRLCSLKHASLKSLDDVSKGRLTTPSSTFY